MEIRFISSLTAEDENTFAPALLKAVGALLDQLPIAYTMRIETTGAQVFQHTHADTEEPKDRSRPRSFGNQRIEAGVLRVDGPFRSSAPSSGPPSGGHLTSRRHTKVLQAGDINVSPAFSCFS